MSKADTLAKLVSTGGPLVDGAIAVSDISGLQTTLDGKLALSGGTLTGNLTFNGTQTWPTFNQNTTGSAATATTATNVSGGTISTTSVINSGNLAFTGTGNRITGDFSNATLANRLMFQTSTTDGTTSVGVIPNGTSNSSELRVYNNSAPTNSARGMLGANASDVRLVSGIDGTGTFLPLIFLTGGSERVRIDTSGNVGIGTSSPSTRLTIGGYSSANQTPDIQITRSSSGTLIQTGPNITFNDGTTNNTTSLQVTQGRFGVWNYGAGVWNERMVMDASGRLGIGTVSPAQRLDVTGVANSVQARFGNVVTRGLEIGTTLTGGTNDATSVLNARGSTFGQLLFQTDGTNRMLIDYNGNVGIGTTSPATRLELSKVYVGAGPTWAGGDDLLKLTAASGSAWAEPAIAFHEIGSNIGAKIGVKNTGNGAMNIIFANRDGGSLTSTMTERARIDVNGNLLVGLTAAETGSTGAVDRIQIAAPLTTDRCAIRFGRNDARGGAIIKDQSTFDLEFVASLNSVTLAGNLIFKTNQNTERARIDSSGNLQVGMTGGSRKINGSFAAASGGIYLETTNADASYLHLSRSGVTFVEQKIVGSNFQIVNFTSGGVSLAAGGTSWGAVSDERLKTAVKPFENAIAKVASLRAGTGRYLTDDEAVSRSFLIAQDVQAVLPEAVDVGSDEQGTLSLRYTDTIPLLVAAIQELKAEFDAYKLTHP
jgi:hypothetical protein